MALLLKAELKAAQQYSRKGASSDTRRQQLGSLEHPHRGPRAAALPLALL